LLQRRREGGDILLLYIHNAVRRGPRTGAVRFYTTPVLHRTPGTLFAVYVVTCGNAPCRKSRVPTSSSCHNIYTYLYAPTHIYYTDIRGCNIHLYIYIYTHINNMYIPTYIMYIIGTHRVLYTCPLYRRPRVFFDSFCVSYMCASGAARSCIMRSAIIPVRLPRCTAYTVYYYTSRACTCRTSCMHGGGGGGRCTRRWFTATATTLVHPISSHSSCVRTNFVCRTFSA